MAADALDPDGTSLPSSNHADLIRRLKRIEGQVRGLQRMIGEGRACSEVIIQMAALREALNKVGVAMIARYMESCLREEVSAAGVDLVDGDKRKKDRSSRLKEAVQMFLKFS
jgi:DNA-binding FrmR family transcriptional regulator